MTLDERIDAATAAGFGKVWVGTAPARGLVMDMLRAAFPELFTDPPTHWLAPWEAGEAMLRAGNDVPYAVTFSVYEAMRDAHLNRRDGE